MIVYRATVRGPDAPQHRQTEQQRLLTDAETGGPELRARLPRPNSWLTIFRPQGLGREAHATHRGVAEASAFAERFVEHELQLRIEDILVNGPPWNTRVALRVHDLVAGPDGGADLYSNRAMLFLEIRWGRLVRWETFEDTQRVEAWDTAELL